MTVVHWKQELSVNIPKIDKQHKTLITMINALSDAIEKNESDSIVEDIITRLSLYAVTHFSDEERFMERYGFTGLPSHIDEHVAFIGQIEDFKRQLSTDKSILARDILIYLMNWILNHIMTVDQKFARFYAEQKVLHGVV